jgi:four helix bundle protein
MEWRGGGTSESRRAANLAEGTMEYAMPRNINRGYVKLDAWNRAQDLVALTYEILRHYPTIGFRIRDQILDAVSSIPANISEGYYRRSIKEYIQFCYVALGSAGEFLSQMVSLKAAGTISDDDFGLFERLHWEVENRTIALVRSLELMRDSGGWVQSIP